MNGLNAFETAAFMAARIDKFGSPEVYNHYAVGWAHAMDTPYQWTKQVASHWGGTHNGMPMDDRAAEHFNSDLAGRPVLVRGTSQILARGMGGLNENGLINIRTRITPSPLK